MQTSIILHDIRSAHNVGSILRTADGAGVSRVYLTGYTPAPLDRFGRVQPEIAKVSLGAAEHVPWESRENIGPLIEELRRDGTAIVAVEQAPDAIDYHRYTPNGDTVFIFGHEVSGLSDATLDQVDAVIELPMRGMKESLNVAVAAGIICYHFTD